MSVWNAQNTPAFGSSYNFDDPSMYNPDGSPKAPGFNTQLDPNGMLNPSFQFNPTTVDPNSLKGFSQFGQEAMRTGPSQFANLQSQLANQNATQQMGKVGAQGAGSLMQSLNALGSHGNRGGAGALLAADNMKNQMFSKQGVGADLQKNLLNIASTDEQNRVGQLGAFSDAEAKLAGANAGIMNQGGQFNIQNQLGELGQGRDYNKFLYGEGMKKWAADRTAGAMERSANAGGGGGITDPKFLGGIGGAGIGFGIAGIPGAILGQGQGSGIGNAISNALGGGGGGYSCWVFSRMTKEGLKIPYEMKELMTKFKNNWLDTDKKFTRFYVKRCKKLIIKMDEAGYEWKNLFWFSEALYNLFKNGQQIAAQDLFQSTIADLVSKYWTDCPFEYGQVIVASLEKDREEFKTKAAPALEEGEQWLSQACFQDLDADVFTEAKSTEGDEQWTR